VFEKKKGKIYYYYYLFIYIFLVIGMVAGSGGPAEYGDCWLSAAGSEWWWLLVGANYLGLELGQRLFGL
jgi:hypothetical protein